MEEVIGKVCTKCRKWKFLYEYHKDKNGTFGRCYHCKECVKEKTKIYYSENREILISKIAEYKKVNKEYRPIKSREYYKKNKDTISEKHKIYNEKNKEKISVRKREKYLQNKEQISIKCKKYRENNKETLAIRAKEKRNRPAKYEIYKDKLTNDESPICGDNGQLVVKCFHCNEFFTPTDAAARHRTEALNRSKGGELHLYCSDQCKQNCDIYGTRITPKSLKYITKKSRCGQNTNKKSLLENQIDNYGNNFCEKCNKQTTKLFIHHGILVSVNYKEADNMAHQVLVCKECHDGLHRNCK